MGSGTARLLVFLLVLEGLAVAHQARDKPLGSRQLPGTESPQNPTSPLTHCDFDASESPFCDWTQPKEDGGGGGEWLRGEGQAPGESPGPPGGSPERRGYYIYPEPRESVQLQSPELNPTVSEVCVEFLYYMYSLSNKAQLAVKIQDTSGNNVTTVWTRTGMQSSAWLLGAVTVHNLVQQRPFKVVLSATQVETSSITIAVDNLSVGVGPCSPCMTGCDFDTLDDLCGWESVAVEDTEWEQWTGPGEQPGVGPEDDFSRPGFGYYMLLDSLAPTSSGTGLLRSPLYQSQGGCLALRFYYTLHGVSRDTALNVYAAAPGSSLDSPLLSLTGEHGPNWHLGAVNYTGTADVQFVFQGVYRGKPGLALDSVRISPCEEIFAQCDFNDDKDPFCGWVQPSDNATPWVRTNQPTPTEETGPPGDYPHGEGYYIYVEAGFLQPGQSVRLASRDFCTSTATCVEFYYSMSGIVETETQLRVLVEGPSGRAELLWARRGVQGPAWLFGSVTVPYGRPQPSKVIFEAVRGSSPYLDVALDNLSVRRGPCAAVAPGTPAPPTGSSAATSVSPEPAITVSPGGPTAVSPTATSHKVTTGHSSRPTTASSQTSRVPRPTTTRATAPSQGFSTSTGHVVPDTSGPNPATFTQSVHTTVSSSTTRGQATSPTTTTGSSASTGPTTSSQENSTSSSSQASSAKTTGHATPATVKTSTISTTASRTSPATSTISTGHVHPTTTGHPSHTTSTNHTSTGLPSTTTGHVTSSLPGTTTAHTSSAISSPPTTSSSHASASSNQSSTTHPGPTSGYSSPRETTTSHATPLITSSGASHSSSTVSPATTTSGHAAPSTANITAATRTSLTTSAHVSLTTPVSHTTPATIASTSHSRPTTATSSHSNNVTDQLSTAPPSPTWPTSQASPQVSTTPRPANPTTNGSTMTSFYTDPSSTQTSPTTTGHSRPTTIPSTTSQTRPRTTSPTAAPSHSTSLTTAVHGSLTTPVSHTTPATIASTSHSRPTTATSSHSSNTQSSPTTTVPSTASQTRPRTTSPTAAPSHSTSTGHSKPSPTSFTTASPAKPTTTLASTSSQTRMSTTGLISPTTRHTSTSALATSQGRPATSSSQAGPSMTSPPSPTSSPISAAATTPLAASTGPPANTLVTSRATSATTRPPAESATTTPTITSVVLTTASAASTTVAKATSAPESSTATTRSPVLPSDRETCTISGDPHYTTFDGRLFHFMGTCTYLLSAVCSATPGLPTFRVEATNEHRGANTQVSYVKAVSVEVSETRIVLLKGRRVTVDGRRVALPVSVAGGQVSVRLSGTFVLVQTDFGLWVRFDGNHHAEVSAPSSYARHLCGLCGNYNGQVSDDNLMPNGTSAGANADRLGESWQVPDAAGDTGCTNSGNPGECDKDVAAEAQKPTSCGILEDPQGPFAACHSKVPPAGAFQSCVYDLCGTGGDAGSLCFALQAYADRCAQAGVTVAWRNSSFCPLNCPAGSSYTPCGPPCPATCTDLAPPSSSSCPNLLCVEGCICEEGSVLSGDKCVPVDQCGCTDSSGQYHPVGDSWMGNNNCTERCVCAGLNNITCKEWSCSPVQKCQLSEGLLDCQDAGVAACHVAGDPHYFTFDSTMVSFMGTCTYTLVMVCHSDPNLPSFTITAKNEERGQPEASYLRLVTVEVAGATVTLQKSRRVLLDGQRVRTPIEGRIPGVSITTSGIYVVLETNFGLVVKFDGNHHLEIQLPGTYFGKVCGMCGNFNNQSQDDLLMPDGHLATNASQFGNSWKAPGDSDPGCQPDNREDLEPSCTPQEMEHLSSLCREILAPKYQPCHSLIDPQLFLQNCLYDMCEYQGLVSVLCDNIQAYVEACKSQGVTGLSWRNSTFCPLPCPPHSHYSECTSPCPATCANLYAPASCQHPTTCVEGCACDRGYVLSDGSCVSMRDCGCLDSRQEYYLPGDSWVTTDCLQRCTCLGNGTIACQPFQCLPGSHCALSTTGVRFCRPTKFHQCVVSGDPHYRTFDAFVHHFQGRATYTLTRTLAELPGALEPLSVAGRNLRRFPFHRVSFLREVYVSVYGYRVTLMQGRKLVVNGVKVTPPYHPQDRLQISQRGRSLFLQTDFGFSVSFDGRDFAEIVLPSTYQNHVGGLCGNYDGRRNNEYMKPDGTWTQSLNTFGNSWQVSAQGAALGRKAGAGGHPRARREEPGEEAESGFEMGCSLEQLTSVNGTEACGALSDPRGPFVACHDTLSPDTFQESCVYDLCALFGDPQLLCQDYEAYAQLCQEEGVALGPWRQKTGCEISCPAHTTYQLCMTACPASCANMAAPSDCSAPCVEGCASDPGYILSGLESVPYNQCGCSRNDQYYQINDTFLTENCSQRCTCRNTNTLECVEAGCSDTQNCTVANYTRGCYEEGPCLSSPCQNEGTCEETSGSFRCLCLEGYVGPVCEETPLDITPTSRPSESLTAILLGVLVPLGVILIGVTAGCIYHQKNKKKTQKEDYGAFLVPGQNRAPDTLGQKITHF